MTTFEDLEARVNFHKENEHVKELLESGNFEIDVWEEGSTSGTLSMKMMIRGSDKMSVETTKFPRYLKTLVCQYIKARCTDIVIKSCERSQLITKEALVDYAIKNPTMKSRVQALLEELK